MNSILQLKTLIFSFFFGCIFFLLSKYNLYITKNMKIIKKYLFTFVFVIDCVLLYIYFLYKLNHGIFHIYFFIVFFLGFTLMYYINPKIKILILNIKTK